MADLHDMLDAARQAADAERTLDVYAGKVEDGEREPNYALAVCLAGLAICAHIEALAVRLDYVAREIAP